MPPALAAHVGFYQALIEDIGAEPELGPVVYPLDSLPNAANSNLPALLSVLAELPINSGPEALQAIVGAQVPTGSILALLALADRLGIAPLMEPCANVIRQRLQTAGSTRLGGHNHDPTSTEIGGAAEVWAAIDATAARAEP